MDWKIPATIIVLILLFIGFTRMDTGIGTNNIVGQVLDKAKKVTKDLFGVISSDKPQREKNISFTLTINEHTSKPFSLENTNLFIDDGTKIYGFDGVLQLDDTLKISGSYEKMEVNGMLLSTPGKIEESNSSFNSVHVSDVFVERLFFSSVSGKLLLNQFHATLKDNDIVLENADFSLTYDKEQLKLKGITESLKVDETSF